MSPRPLIWQAFAVLLLLTGVVTASPEDDASKTKTPDGASLDRILRDWARNSAARTGLDVRFVREARDNQWGEKKNYTGRVVLLPKGLALVETQKVVRAGEPAQTERLVWRTDEFHQIRLEQKVHLITPIVTNDQGRLPAALALPFFWNLSWDGLKSRYRIELVRERPESWLLRITPLTTIGRESFSTAFLSLDRSTYLPRHYYLVSPDRKSTTDFRVTQVQRAELPPEDLLAIPEESEWNVSRIGPHQMRGWLSSFFQPDLLP